MLQNLKFQYKVYLLSFLLILAFVSSFSFYQSSVNNIAEKIKRLNKENETLQKTLVLISEVEKLNRYVDQFINFGDKALLTSIEETLTLFLNIDDSLISVNDKDEFKLAYKQIINNIEKFKHDFEIAKEHVATSFELRLRVRTQAQQFEDQIDTIKNMDFVTQNPFELILIKKSILLIEKSVVRYFETNNAKYVTLIKQESLKLNKIIAKLSQNKLNASKEISTQIQNEATSFIALINKTISHYRTYSMITKVILPGDMYEVSYYSDKIRYFTEEKILFTKNEIDNLLSDNKNFNLSINIFYILLIFLSIFIVVRVILRPLESLTKMFEDLLMYKKDIKIPQYTHDDIIGKLIKVALEFKLLNNKTNELLKETNDYKENLERKVKQEINLRREQEKALIQQSKLASMGEMIGAIAHQWRQPLNELSIRIQKIKYIYAREGIDEEYITDFVEKNRKTIEFMSNTIDDFRNFFRIDKEKKDFDVKQALNEVLNIQNAQLKDHHIELEFIGESFVCKGFKSEFQQVIINLISNAKDAFISNKVKEPKILILLSDNKLIIQDNAGGIDNDIIDRIFEPYFTTKEQGKGTGMGLYMSKMIIEDNMEAKLNIKNIDEGIEVSILFGSSES